jgi:hypothetical protein
MGDAIGVMGKPDFRGKPWFGVWESYGKPWPFRGPNFLALEQTVPSLGVAEPIQFTFW